MFNPKKPDAPNEPDKAQVFVSLPSNAKSFSAYVNAAENCSIINEWLTMRGDLESTGDILVKGKVHGNIRCNLLIIDTDARIEGGIEAEEVVVRGATRGIIHAKKVRVEKTGNVDSEMYQDSFSSEEGARVRGLLRNYDELPGEGDAPSAKSDEAARHSNGHAAH